MKMLLAISAIGLLAFSEAAASAPASPPAHAIEQDAQAPLVPTTRAVRASLTSAKGKMSSSGRPVAADSWGCSVPGTTVSDLLRDSTAPSPSGISTGRKG